MKAWSFVRYGSPDDLVFEDVPVPRIASDEVLVRVRASSVNPYDWRHVRADPFLVRLSRGLLRPPAGAVLGTDLSGEVVEVGDDVTRFRTGDGVLGGVELGAFAEYAAVPAGALAAKPDSVSFTTAGAVPMAGLTALQALRDDGRVRPGQRVLVNGASGGVGHLAVQLAVVLGASVTGVCSTRNVAFVRSIGASDVVDYTREDFTTRPREHDVVIDTVGNRSLADLRRVLRPDGTLVIVGGGGGRILGPAAQVLRARMLAPFVRHRIATVVERADAEDLAFLADLLGSGTVTPSLERVHDLPEIPEALRRVETGHVRGKVAVRL